MGNQAQSCCAQVKQWKKKGYRESHIQSSLSSIIESNRNSLQRPVTDIGIRQMKDQVKFVVQKFSNHPKKTNDLRVSQMQPMKLIGKGSFGKVYLVRIQGQVYAMKQIKKRQLVRSFQVENLFYEKHILQCHSHPFIVQLFYAFQDNIFINLIMDFVPGGELFWHLNKRKTFSLTTTRFYAAQIVLVYEYLHNELNVIYRDLKPENILIDTDGYIKLTDFGLSKDASKPCHSFCGTPEYLAPEVIEDLGHNLPVDMWTLGCLIYEMNFGVTPFKATSRSKLFEMIRQDTVTFPANADEDTVVLLKALLSKNVIYHLINKIEQPLKRPTVDQVKGYAFFEGINWMNLYKKRIPAPIHPIIMNDSDTRNFDQLKESLDQQSRKARETTAEENSLFDGFDLQIL